MNNLLYKSWFRFISLVLINAFLMLDIAWAGEIDSFASEDVNYLAPIVQMDSQSFLANFDKAAALLIAEYINSYKQGKWDKAINALEKASVFPSRFSEKIPGLIELIPVSREVENLKASLSKPKKKVTFTVYDFRVNEETPEDILPFYPLDVKQELKGGDREGISHFFQSQGIPCKVYKKIGSEDVGGVDIRHCIVHYGREWIEVEGQYAEKARRLFDLVNNNFDFDIFQLREILERIGKNNIKLTKTYLEYKKKHEFLTIDDFIRYYPDLEKKVVGIGERHSFFESGQKDRGFVFFNDLELPSNKAGIVLSYELANEFRRGKLPDFYGIHIYEQLRKNHCGGLVSVRSDPIISMPGILKTELEVPIPYNDGAVDLKPLLKAIEEVAKSWDSEKAKLFRKRNGIPEEFKMNIIIQKMGPMHAYGFFKGDLWGSGVFTTRDPNSGENKIVGVFKRNALGDALMTGGQDGEDLFTIDSFYQRNKKIHEAKYPSTWDNSYFEQIKVAAEKLESYLRYPQEVEFVIDGGGIVFMQTRPMRFSPQGEINYLHQMVKEGSLTEAQLIPKLEKLSERLDGRLMFKVDERVSPDKYIEGVACTAGALQGQLVFSIEKAKRLARNDKPIIFVAASKTKEAMLEELFEYKNVALITNYGNSSSHEAVLTRMAGIPSIINIKNAQINNNQIAFAEEVFREGDVVILDGNNNRIFASPLDVLEVDYIVRDGSFGMNIIEYRKNFLADYLTPNGEVKGNISFEHLLDLNLAKVLAYDLAVREGDKKQAFRKNFEKHLVHELLFKKGRELGKASAQIQCALQERLANEKSKTRFERSHGRGIFPSVKKEVKILLESSLIRDEDPGDLQNYYSEYLPLGQAQEVNMVDGWDLNKLRALGIDCVGYVMASSTDATPGQHYCSYASEQWIEVDPKDEFYLRKILSIGRETFSADFHLDVEVKNSIVEKSI